MRPRAAVPSMRTPIEGRHVLMGLIAFFGVIFAVNSYFLYSALSTHTGVVANEPYRKGLAYNERIAAEERQSALGWEGEVALASSGRVSLALKASGAPVQGLLVTATVGRPATASLDRSAQLKEAAAGTYLADVGALPEGSWILSLEARHEAAGHPVYRMRRRISVKP